MFSKSKNANIAFFAIVIVASAIIETMYCFMGVNAWLALLMWIPAIAATVANIMIMKEKQEKSSFKTLLGMGGLKNVK